LPLLQWSLENLFYYGKYAPECDPFLQKVVIHAFRLHLQYANEMLVLMHREDSLYTASHAFGKEQEFNAKKDLKEDAPYCSFSEDLQSSVNLQRYTHLNKERVQSIKKSNLLYSIYRIEKLVDIYKVPGYFHTINDSDLERALNAVNHVSNIFSVDNIKAILINRIYSLATSPDFYDREIFEETYSEVMTSLDNLMYINLLSVSDKIEVMKEIDRPVKLRKETLGRGGKV
jgi:hypothetical protein